MVGWQQDYRAITATRIAERFTPVTPEMIS
jgi:hypothetical protein